MNILVHEVRQQRQQHGAGKISLVVHTNHLDGAFSLSMSYIFGKGRSANHVRCVKVTLLHPKQNQICDSVLLSPDDTIITSIETALRYFEYAKKHLEGAVRTHPMPLHDWLVERNRQ